MEKLCKQLYKAVILKACARLAGMKDPDIVAASVATE
jgi:hypothetical protein